MVVFRHRWRWSGGRENLAESLQLSREGKASAADVGGDMLWMMEASQHRRVKTVQGYVRRASLFKGHAGAGFL